MARLPKTFSRPLCETLVELAGDIWIDLRDAWHAGLIRDEETITNDLLLALWRRHPHELIIRQLKKPQESLEGADWEWWFTDGATWFGMLVQAKRLNVATQSYQGLDKSVKSSGQLQIDLLLSEAHRKNIHPIYCFYNYTNQPPLKIGWNCGTIAVPKDELFACSVADARAIRHFVSRNLNHVAEVSRASFPWSCLVCCPYGGKGRLSPAKVFGTARLIATRSQSQLGATEVLPVPQPRAQPPSYIRILMELRPEDVAEVPLAAREEAGPVNAIAIVKTLPSAAY
jgi:hypothetical protein